MPVRLTVGSAVRTVKSSKLLNDFSLTPLSLSQNRLISGLVADEPNICVHGCSLGKGAGQGQGDEWLHEAGCLSNQLKERGTYWLMARTRDGSNCS